MPARTRRVLTLAALAAVVIAIAVIIISNGRDEKDRPPTVTHTLGGPGHEKIPLTPPAQAIVKTQAKEDAQGKEVAAESDLHDPLPPAPADAAAAKTIQPPGQPEIPANVPLAAASEPGCSTKLVRNYSSRRGAPVLLGVIHWTGSRPTPGSAAGGLAIVRWFDTPAAQASSNYITDPDGRCWLVVPESQKSWTQAGFNPWSVSVEIINQGVQPLFPRSAGRARVIKLMRGWHKRWGIPYRYAHVSGCRVTRSGFLAHRDLGSCGGGHPDVGTFNLPGLIAEAKRGGIVNTRDQIACRKLRWWRANGRPHGQPEINAVKRRKQLQHHRIACR